MPQPANDHTYRVTEVVGTSPESIHQAVRNGIARANQTVRHLEWFEVSEIRGWINDGEVGHFQVTIKLGFRLDDER
jgi:flavin-binding protein dodecin